MANPVQGQVQQPAAAPVEPQIGNLNDHEVRVLFLACQNKHDDQGSIIGKILSVAAIAAGLFAALTIPGVTGIILGLAIYFIGGNLLSNTYHGLRNQDYLDAGSALKSKSFKEYAARNNVDLTIDNILAIHKQYKQYAAGQAQQLVAAQPV